MNHASGAVAPPDAEVIQICDASWQRAEGRGEVLVFTQDGHEVALVPDQGPVSSSRRQLPIQRSMIEFIRGA